MSNNESIKDTLDVIRRALEDKEDFTEKNENILILNKKVNDDGTVKLLNQSDDVNAINKVIDKKLNDLMEKKMSAMLKNQIPIILDKYFKNIWTLEWKNGVPLIKRLLIVSILLSPFLLFILYIIFKQ